VAEYPYNRLADAERGRGSRARVAVRVRKVALPVVGLAVGRKAVVADEVVVEVVGLVVEWGRRARDERSVVGAGVGSVEALMGLGPVGFAGTGVRICECEDEARAYG
jgi:hypothetical protein